MDNLSSLYVGPYYIEQIRAFFMFKLRGWDIIVLRKLRVFLIVFLVFFIFPVKATTFTDIVINEVAWPVKAAYAANGLKMGTIVINEIAWMGTASSYADEWIELYNNSNSSIDFLGWKLFSEDGTPEINLERKIPAKGFFLLERTDDNTVPEITADLIYKGALGNNNESLKLFDDSGNIIDEVNCSTGWFTGDNSTKQTMERKDTLVFGNDPKNWQTSQNPEGTPKAKNSLIFQGPKSTPPESEAFTLENNSPLSEPAEVQPPIIENLPEDIPLVTEPAETWSPLTYPEGVVFNEILPSPEGPDETEEWIELRNLNNEKFVLSAWKIRDTTGKTTAYVFPEETKIPANGFLVLYRPNTRITLNNSSDGLILLQPNDNIADSVAYEKAPLNQSYNKTESGWVWSSTLTPDNENIVPVLSPKERILEEKTEIGQKLEESKTELLAGISPQKELTAAVQQFSLKASFYVYLIAAILAIFSGTIILILKKKIKKQTNSFQL